MCLIVDANVVSQVFGPQPSDDFRPVHDALIARRARAVHGGQLTDEYVRVLGRLVAELDRQGILRLVPHDAVNRRTDELRNDGNCRSDDEHVIALAAVANVRLLCSHDRDLHADFTNPRLLAPRGNVYQRRQHAALIRRHCKVVGKPG